MFILGGRHDQSQAQCSWMAIACLLDDPVKDLHLLFGQGLIGGPSGAVVICRLGLSSASGFGGGTLAGLDAKALCARSAAGFLVRSSSGFLVVWPPRRLWTTSTISIPLGSHRRPSGFR